MVKPSEPQVVQRHEQVDSDGESIDEQMEQNEIVFRRFVNDPINHVQPSEFLQFRNGQFIRRAPSCEQLIDMIEQQDDDDEFDLGYINSLENLDTVAVVWN